VENDAPIRSKNIYLIKADRRTSQFGQHTQDMRCRIVGIHENYINVESLKRYNKKYENASMVMSGKYKGIPIRRINRNQIHFITDEKTGRNISWEEMSTRELEYFSQFV
jgi:hypothetical protein